MDAQKTDCLIVAEIGTAHNGSIKKAKELVYEATHAGADCIKFQWVYAHEILHPKTGTVSLPSGSISLYKRFQELEVNPSFFKTMQDYVHSLGKKFMCSPFGIQSLNELFAIKPDFIKIASPELNHIPLLNALITLQNSQLKPIPTIISSGVSTLDDIKLALSILNPLTQKKALNLLHCITAYPAPPEEYNLSLLSVYENTFKIPCGVSDHSLDSLLVPLTSIFCGGKIIEKHFTLANTDDGLDDKIALNPKNFKNMTTAIKSALTLTKTELYKKLIQIYGKTTVDTVIGNGKKTLAQSEQENYGKTNRSIHVMRSLKKGHIVKNDDVAVLRTEKNLSVGLHPQYFEQILGKTLTCNITDGEGLQWEHLQ